MIIAYIFHVEQIIFLYKGKWMVIAYIFHDWTVKLCATGMPVDSYLR